MLKVYQRSNNKFEVWKGCFGARQILIVESFQENL
jgi:hypothetical protein